ncbi:MAG: transcription antitermination factor NusB [Acidimicrobiia bacterium]
MTSPEASARSVAYAALLRIEQDGAYANLVLPAVLGRSKLDTRDKAFATDLVYGTTRMRRACDSAIDRFVVTPPQPEVRTLLRLGAYQLLFGGVAAHAAVSATVSLAPPRVRGFVNAILRRISAGPVSWEDDATRLSYPDWIVDRLRAELGADDAIVALERMNEPPSVHERPDGYVQDLASQWVAELVGAVAGERVLDLCAAPGGKATFLAASGATTVAADLRVNRARLVAANAKRIGVGVHVVAADGTRPPFVAGAFDRVLLDAPCSGLGVLRRRADARWRISSNDVDELAALQQRLIDGAAELVRPGGLLVYSVCTLTAAESIDHRFPAGWTAEPVPGGPWRPYGDGGRLLPQDADTDGMVVLRYRRPA